MQRQNHLTIFLIIQVISTQIRNIYGVSEIKQVPDLFQGDLSHITIETLHPHDTKIEGPHYIVFTSLLSTSEEYILTAGKTRSGQGKLSFKSETQPVTLTYLAFDTDNALLKESVEKLKSMRDGTKTTFKSKDLEAFFKDLAEQNIFPKSVKKTFEANSPFYKQGAGRDSFVFQSDPLDGGDGFQIKPLITLFLKKDDDSENETQVRIEVEKEGYRYNPESEILDFRFSTSEKTVVEDIVKKVESSQKS